MNGALDDGGHGCCTGTSCLGRGNIFGNGIKHGRRGGGDETPGVQSLVFCSSGSGEKFLKGPSIGEGLRLRS